MGKARATSLNRQFGYCTLVPTMFSGNVQDLEHVQALYLKGNARTRFVDCLSRYRKLFLENRSFTVEDSERTPYDLGDGRFRCAMLPGTSKREVLKKSRQGYAVNLEFDTVRQPRREDDTFVHSD